MRNPGWRSIGAGWMMGLAISMGAAACATSSNSSGGKPSAERAICENPSAVLFEETATCLGCPDGFELANSLNGEKYECVSGKGDAAVRIDPTVKGAVTVPASDPGFFTVSPAKGRAAAVKLGCLKCHSVDGSPSPGPSWKGLYGSLRRVRGGAPVVADEKYLRDSILNPGARMIMPYTSSYQYSMPTDLKPAPDELASIVEYIRGLR